MDKIETLELNDSLDANSEELTVLKNTYAYKKVNGRINNSIDNSLSSMSEARKEIIKLFLAMYSIRCALFHGEKEFRVIRGNNEDKEVVAAAGTILEGYLRTILSKS